MPEQRQKTLYNKGVVLKAILDFKKQNNGNSPSISMLAKITGLSNQTAWRAALYLRSCGELEYDETRGGFIVPNSTWLY